MNFNWLDIIIGIILVLTAFQGMRQGLALAVFNLLAPFLAVFVANKGADQVAEILLGLKLPYLLAYYLALIGLILLVYWLVILVGKNFAGFVEGSFLKNFNALGGFVAGTLTGGFYVFVVFFPIVFYFFWFDGLARTLQQSYIYTQAKPLVVNARPLVENIVFKSAQRWRENVTLEKAAVLAAPIMEKIDTVSKQADVLSAF